MATSSLCFLKTLVPFFAILVAPLVFLFGFLGYGSLPIFLTSSLLVLSTLVFTITKQKPHKMVENSVKEVEVVSELKPEVEKEEAQECEVSQMKECLEVSLDPMLESESFGNLPTSQDSEVEWPFQEDVDKSDANSDGSISDEESLIEIALADGHYMPKKLQDFSPDSIFRHHTLMELLAELNEMNEEENLIEIDISMGSIKCSGFGIEA